MPPTLVLLDEWPNTRACPVSHDALGAHDVLKDVLLSDTDRLRSLRDMISDGALFAELRRAGVAIELFTLNSTDNPIIMGVKDMCGRFEACSDEASLIEALKTSSGALRVVVSSGGSFQQQADKKQGSAEKAAAVSGVVQSLAIRSVLDLAARIIQVSDAASCFVVSYGSVMFSNGAWTRSAAAGGLWPKQALMPAPARPTVAPALLTKLVKASFPAVQEKALYADHGVALTLDECDEGSSWTCSCRLTVGQTNYRVVRTLPPDGLLHLNKAFLAIEDVDEWLVQDENGDDNLTTSVEWMAGDAPTALLAACHPAVCELAKFRMLVPLPQPNLAPATAAADAPPRPAADAPPRPAADAPAPRRPTRRLLPGRRRATPPPADDAAARTGSS